MEARPTISKPKAANKILANFVLKFVETTEEKVNPPRVIKKDANTNPIIIPGYV